MKQYEDVLEEVFVSDWRSNWLAVCQVAFSLHFPFSPPRLPPPVTAPPVYFSLSPSLVPSSHIHSPLIQLSYFSFSLLPLEEYERH